MSQPGVEAPIEVHWAEEDPCLPEERVREAARAALREGGRPGIGLSLVFVSEVELTRLHLERLGDPEPTDVMAFDLGEDAEGPAGELYVSVDRAREVASELDAPLERELLLYVVHGVLHLCGHDDHDAEDVREMRAAEARVLRELGLATDPERHA